MARRWRRPARRCYSGIWRSEFVTRSTQIYGYSFTLNEITGLSTEEYSERALRECRPETLDLQATHTYNWLPGVEIIDGARGTQLAKT
jgi:hypothetical protein